MPRLLRVAKTIVGRQVVGRLRPGDEKSSASLLRESFEELGPAFVKIGQLMSVRPDVFPASVVFEMSKLRDEVTPEPFASVMEVFRKDFGQAPNEVFDEFRCEPIASASIAQVHVARLKRAVRPAWGDVLEAGSEVAVKIVRPGAAAVITKDLALASRLAALLAVVPAYRAVDLRGLVEEARGVAASELDMRVEGRMADEFAFDFRNDRFIQVPRVAWPFTTRRILTMEYVSGWRLSELDDAVRSGIDAESLARRGAEAFMRQVLEHGRFHADLHPSNLFVTPDSRIAYLDFGIVGRLSLEERRHVGLVLAALVDGDADAALVASEPLGLSVPDSSRGELARELEDLMSSTLRGDSDIRHFGLGLLSVLRKRRVSVPRGWGLLVKALVTVEGVARALYPHIDLIETARPYAKALKSREALLGRHSTAGAPR